MKKTLVKIEEDYNENSFLFKHVKIKILKKNSEFKIKKAVSWVKSLIQALDSNSDKLKECLKKRKTRSFILPY